MGDPLPITLAMTHAEKDRIGKPVPVPDTPDRYTRYRKKTLSDGRIVLVAEEWEVC